MRFLTRPKVLGVLAGILLLLVIGFIFLRGPIAHIELQAEALTPPLFSLGPLGDFIITNSIVAAWLSILVLLGFSLAATRNMRVVPRGTQNFVEAIVEMFLNLVEGVAGKKNGRRFFPLVATIFLFILTSNWMGLLPGFGTIGLVGEKELAHFQSFSIIGFNLYYIPIGSSEGAVIPFLRSANTDLNTPLAMALMAMVFVEYWGISALGFFNYSSKFFNVRRLLRGDIINGFIDLYIGMVEAITELARIVSFTFRLFGNIFAGEILLAVMSFLIPLVVVVPFFGLELFVGFIQALIFAVLTLVFAVIAVEGHGEEEHVEARTEHVATSAA
ncbi:MAG: F0F1 ATP synthase subunit A [Chloroflexi bacterium]|nr:F0F1 ATP synthase subunit A [Chloroflexota bacterium]